MNLTRSFLYTAVLVLTIAACESDPAPEQSDISALSETARNYLSMKLSNANAANGQDAALNRGNPINESFQRLYGNAMAGGRLKKDSTDVADSTIYEDPWVTCAQITNTENADGSITTIIDYGDGCEEGYDTWKYFMHGRMEYTYKTSNSNEGTIWRDQYEYHSTTNNYGGSYSYEGKTWSWLSNGTSSYKGSSQYNSATEEYSGQYEYAADDTYQWDESTYHTVGAAKSSYSNNQSVTEESDFMYETNEDYYHNVALTPLVARFDCWNNYYADAPTGDAASPGYFCYYVPYVSGIEKISYKQGTEEGSFEIDYGDGTCDSKVVIIENGIRVAIDLSTTAPGEFDK